MTISDIPANTSNRVITVNFTGGERGRILDDNNSGVNQLGRPRVEELSKKNDSFEELATRLTDFFSQPEAQNDKASAIKNACWNDLTDDKKPVFEPDFSNLKNAQFSKSSEGLTITLSKEHVNEGYLQVLSDLTLVAEVIKRSISKEAEDPIGFTSNPIEKIKIISHPERNLVIPVDKITKNLDYQIGPEFKFIQSETYGLIPVANGMFNLDDVRGGKLGTVNKDNKYLEEFAFNGKDSLNNPLSHVYDFNRSYLTPQNKIFILPPENKRMNGYRAVMEGYGYQKIQGQLQDILSIHNSGRIIDNSEGNQLDILGTTRRSYMDPIYKQAIRSTALYEDCGNDIFRPKYQEDVGLNPAAAALLEIDSLTLQGRNGTSALKKKVNNYITTEYARRNQNPKTLSAIYNSF